MARFSAAGGHVRDGSVTQCRLPTSATIGDFDGDGDDDVAVGYADGLIYADTPGQVVIVPGPIESASSVVNLAARSDVGTLHGGDRDGAGVALSTWRREDGDRLLVGAPSARANGGAVYVIAPSTASTTGDHTLDEIAEVTFEGDEPYDDNLGVTAGPIGDVDGDGLVDLAFGTLGSAMDPMELFVVLGRDRWASVVVAGDVALANYTTNIDGATRVSAGPGIVDAGDLDGDGRDDLVASDGGGNDGGGHVYVVTSVREETATFEAAASMRLDGGLGFGRSLASAGDIDGDARADLLIGSPSEEVGSQPLSGAAWVCPAWALPLDGTATADVDAGWLRFTGDPYGRAGEGVAGVGNVDGAGYDDFVIAQTTDASLFYTGAN